MRKPWIALISIVLFAQTAFAGETIWEPNRYGVATSEKDNSATIFDIKTNIVVKTVKTGKIPHPLAFTPNGKKLYIANRGENTLSVLDMPKFEVIKTIKIKWNPSCVAVSHNGKILAVTGKEESEVLLIDTATDQVIKNIPILQPNSTPQKPPLHGLTMTHPIWSDDDNLLYVNIVPRSIIVKIDGKTFDVVSTLQTPTPVHMMYILKGKLYALTQGRRMMNQPPGVAVYDVETDQQIGYVTIPLKDGEPSLGHHACVVGDVMYVANMGNTSEPWGSTIALIDLKTMKVIKTLEGPKGAGHPLLTPDGKYVFVSGHGDNRLFVVDTKTQEVVKRIKFGEKEGVGHGCFFSPDGERYYVVSNVDNAVYAINVNKMEVTAKIPTGEFPNDMSLNFMDAYK
jgi:YVTN family beta-propeller protein